MIKVLEGWTALFFVFAVIVLVIIFGLATKRVSSPMFVEVSPEVSPEASPEVAAEVDPWQSLGSWRVHYREFETEFASCVVIVGSNRRVAVSCVPLKIEAR